MNYYLYLDLLIDLHFHFHFHFLIIFIIIIIFIKIIFHLIISKFLNYLNFQYAMTNYLISNRINFKLIKAFLSHYSIIFIDNFNNYKNSQ